MPFKDFLEDYPLFKKYRGNFPSQVKLLRTPPLNMDCSVCDSVQTWVMSGLFQHQASGSPAGKRFKAHYVCQSCQKSTREFYFRVSNDLNHMYKYGQYPEWKIALDKNLESALGEHVDYYRKGLVCESQGYGIAAFGYFRRIAEKLIDQLLDDVEDLVDASEKNHYKEALQSTKNAHNASEKIELTKDLLPEILKPKGMNPLGVLYGELSDGMHSKSDDDCLESAGVMKDCLVFLVNQISINRNKATEFTAGIQSFLNKKSERAAKAAGETTTS